MFILVCMVPYMSVRTLVIVFVVIIVLFTVSGVVFVKASSLRHGFVCLMYITRF